jgi:ferric-dicitrate binding protein FerR (iron transport regulator)
VGSSPLFLKHKEGCPIQVDTRSGRVTVSAEDRKDVAIVRGQDYVEVTHDGDGALTLLSGHGGSEAIEVLCPAGTSIIVGTLSGGVELKGQLGAVRVTTMSGRIEAERATVADLRTANGRIKLDSCEGACRIQNRTGRIEVGECGTLEAFTDSGSIAIGRAAGRVRVRSTSGQVEVGGNGSQDVAVQTMSGSVKVRLPAGTRPRPMLHSLSGRTTVGCEQGDDCRIAVESLSGKIEVVPG